MELISPITEQADALAELNRLARMDECPELTSTEQTNILAKYKRASLWAASTVYQLGARVIPTLANRNGHRMVAVRYANAGSDQKSGTDEPVWIPDSLWASQGDSFEWNRSAVYTDGSIIWREEGWDWNAILWDFNGAAREAWKTKAGKAAMKSDFRLPSGISVSASQIYKNCIEQMKTFRSVSVA